MSICSVEQILYVGKGQSQPRPYDKEQECTHVSAMSMASAACQSVKKEMRIVHDYRIEAMPNARRVLRTHPSFSWIRSQNLKRKKEKKEV